MRERFKQHVGNMKYLINFYAQIISDNTDVKT